MAPRRRPTGGAVSFHLIDPIQRHVQPVSPFVLDHCDLDRALADEEPLDAAIDTDAVFEVHDVVTRLERRDRVERDARAVTSGPAQPPVAAEDLVVGEDAEAAGVGNR